MPTERELLALCLRWLESPGLIHPFDKAMLIEAVQAKLNPEPRPWVGLTDEDLTLCESEEDVRFAHAIEAKLKEKNT